MEIPSPNDRQSTHILRYTKPSRVIEGTEEAAQAAGLSAQLSARSRCRHRKSGELSPSPEIRKPRRGKACSALVIVPVGAPPKSMTCGDGGAPTCVVWPGAGGAPFTSVTCSNGTTPNRAVSSGAYSSRDFVSGEANAVHDNAILIDNGSLINNYEAMIIDVDSSTISVSH